MKKKKVDKKALFISKNSSKIRIGLYFIALLLLMIGIVRYSVKSNYVFEHKLESLFGKYKVKDINYDDVPEVIIVEPKTHVSLEVLDDGYKIYSPASGSSGYRYGPSIIINDDGSYDVWFSSPGNYHEWDWITYRHSDDGVNWDKEKIVLQPTGNSMDHYSVCDPGVIYFNGYYYLGYTSTIVATNQGINNNCYVARSKNPDGPFEKWNGNGWGGEPEPIIYYNESNDYWGAGELSFVIKDDTLFCYYSWYCEHGFYTRVSTADLSENWPSTLEYQGVTFDRKYGQDSSDVVYLEDYDKFIAFSIANRFSDSSSVLIYESDDGINFRRSDLIQDKISMYAHNLGISKRLDGHIKEDDGLYISYAYGSSANSKGKWATRFQPVRLIIYEDTKRRSFNNGVSSTYRGDIYTSKKQGYLSGIGVKSRTINVNIDGTASINPIGYNQYHVSMGLNGNCSYEYDEDIIKMKGNKVIPLKIGETEVVVKYKDFYTTCNVIVHDKSFNPLVGASRIISFIPVQDEFVFHIENEDYHSAQIRARVEFNNGKWGEAYNDYTRDHPNYPAMVNAANYHMTYEVEDEKIAYVDDKGIISPKSVGQTNIKVTMNDDLSFVVHVKVDY